MRRARQPSLPEVHDSIPVRKTSTFWRRLFTFTGPAFMVAVGYTDPGNWATDLAGGAQFGYQLIWVILISNLMAIVLQTLSARLGLATRRDLAQSCRDHYPPPITWLLWGLSEIAIAACDLAEVLGTAIGLHLLLGLPILWGVVVTAFDVMLLLALQSYGIRKIEAVILSLVATIGICFAVEMFLSKPPVGAVLLGFVPGSLGGGKLYVAIGILGATVMPHNLYLHSALVQSRAIERTERGISEAAGFNLLDSVVALNGAFFVNVAILVLAAATFFTSGHQNVATLEEAHSLLDPLLGSALAPIAFALALLAAGQSSTITGTLAGQVVMEGFISIRLRPWLRRIITRSLAIIPAVIVILWKGDRSVDVLLVLSQVILSLQLSFAIIPLIHFTSDRRKMGSFVTPWWGKTLAWISAAVIICLNAKLVFESVMGGLEAGNFVVRWILLPVTVLLVPLLIWMIVEPLWRRWQELRVAVVPTAMLPTLEAPLNRQFRRVAIALEASLRDSSILAGVIPLIRAAKSEVVLIHVVESAVARFIGLNADDEEVQHDLDYLDRVANQLRQNGITCSTRIGAGEPEDEIARIAEEEKINLIVTGSHGHRLLGDIFHGSTINELRQLTSIPVMTIRTHDHAS